MSSDAAISSRSTTGPRSLGVLPQWMMAFALSVCAIMIVGLLGLIVAQGAASFWPKPVDEITLHDGGTVLGIPIRSGVNFDGDPQTLYRIGNRDLGQIPFRWISESEIESRSRPSDVVLLERREWGIFIGRLAPDPETGETTTWEGFAGDLDDGAQRRREIDGLRGGALARVNRELTVNRQQIAEADLRLADGQRSGLGSAPWVIILGAGLLACGASFLSFARRARLRGALVAAGGLLVLWTALERPGLAESELVEWHQARVESLADEQREIEQRFVTLNERLVTLEDADRQHRVSVAASDGTLAPESQSATDRRLMASQVIRAIRPNAMSLWDRFGVFGSRWAEYLIDDPREANTEGGIFPVIVGTVTVTLLLTVVVVPLGVLAALYIREYAKQGVLISVLRVAINNLAGVPSIVYGIFGLGFFCYAVGGYIDGGPDASVTMGKAAWWIVAIGCASAFVSALLFRSKVRAAGVLWALGATAVLVLFATSPYFDGFFRVKLLDGEPTFGSSGLLWASLTLALLTLPVVIVSTEEAIAAVPQSLREASYGCGASRWQTISRVVLPGAMPGVMTGTILAMARGAGEVAPLMVVGAVKLAPELPIEPRAPFVFADRSFMHLGFHIFDLGFQSPDSEAARGMVWTTTLLLIVLVVTMNLAAIYLRGRLRSRLVGGHF